MQFACQWKQKLHWDCLVAGRCLALLEEEIVLMRAWHKTTECQTCCGWCVWVAEVLKAELSIKIEFNPLCTRPFSLPLTKRTPHGHRRTQSSCFSLAACVRDDACRREDGEVKLYNPGWLLRIDAFNRILLLAEKQVESNRENYWDLIHRPDQPSTVNQFDIKNPFIVNFRVKSKLVALGKFLM